MILALFAINVVLAVMHVLGPPVPSWAARGDDDREYLWDLTVEGNVPSWYSGTQLVLIGALMLGLAANLPRKRASTVVLVLTGLLFAFLSLDELVSLHEKFGRFLEDLGPERGDTAFGVTGVWFIVVAPAFVLVVAGLAYAGRELITGRRRVQLLYLAGLVLFVGSFAGLELLVNFVSEREREIEVLEETGEMFGATVLLWATYELLRSHGVRVFAREAEAPPGP